MKVYELAKELDIGAVDLVDKLKEMGLDVKNHMVSLSTEEVAKAKSVFMPSPTAASGKKVVKKVAKKVAKKTVVKKVTKVDEEAPLEAEEAASVSVVPIETAEASQVVSAEETATEKPKVTKMKTVTRKAADIKEGKIQAALQKEADAENDEGKTELYKEKLHSFTPVFIPEDVKKKQEEQKAAREIDRINNPHGPAFSADDEESDKNKKRVADLAAIVNKKAVASKSKELLLLKAEEEMKLASTVLGNGVYTPAKRKKVYSGPTKQTLKTEVKDAKRVIYLNAGAPAAEIAQKLSQRFEDFQNKCLELNLLVAKEDYIGLQLAEEMASLYNYRVENKAFDEGKILGADKGEDQSKLPLRNPIITVMGHVDHGKTSLLDYIRSAKVATGEAGGITQHIGAYNVNVADTTITFLDTPGHAAFGAMRQRGANVTDIVVLVVAADDGVMPQTVESIKFAQNANCPIIVAVNKMDKESANPEKVKQMMMEFNLTPEEWGGETQFVGVSALKGTGIDELLEAIKVQAEMMELRADPKGIAEGIVIESKIEAGRGPVATILVQKGTLSQGDSLVVGEFYGRARSLMDSSGEMVKVAGPSVPVQILGLNGVAIPGETVNVVKNEREAKKIVDNRIAERKALENTEVKKVASLEDFFATTQITGTQEKKVLKLIIRTDVQGSFEAIKDALLPLGNDEVSVDIIGGGVGAITEGDVTLAASSGGYIMGFNMRPVTAARKLAEDKGVDVKTYSIIYELINDVTMALEGMLEPEKVEKFIGRSEVRQTFSIPKIGTIAGCIVIDGKIERGCNIRLLREGKIIFDGKLSTLKRFKDEVKEVKNGYECGMALENFDDVKVGDQFEAYIMENIKRTLEPSSKTL